MIEKTDRLIYICATFADTEIEEQFTLSDSIEFEFQKLYEDSTRLSSDFLRLNPVLPIDKLRAIRNRVAHDYENVSMRILIDTVREDIPGFRDTLIALSQA